MPTTRPARPAAKLAAGTRVRAKKSPAKRAAKKSAKPKSPRTLKREAAAKRDASVEKRKQTRAATNVVVGSEPIAVDPSDEVAVAAIAKRQVRTAVDRVDDPPPTTGIALVERVTRAVERELSHIEVIVGGHHVKPGQRTEAERRARTLASLARTLTEVRKLRADEHRVKPQDDPDRPRDIEELRRRLAERLGQFVRGTTDLPGGNDEVGGDRLHK